MKTPLVGTVEIVGVDRESPGWKARSSASRAARSVPSTSPGRSSRAIEKIRFMVYTSFDVRFGHWVQRKFAPPYELAIAAARPRTEPRRP